MDDMTELAKSLSERLEREITKLRNKVGTVTALTTPTTVTVDGTAMQLHRLSSYTPALSDIVYVDVSVQNWLILGKIV